MHIFLKFKDFISATVTGATGIVFMGLYFGGAAGALYWLWLAVKLDSFFMFFIGLAGPAILITSPIGLYALIFGTPEWVIRFFG